MNVEKRVCKYHPSNIAFIVCKKCKQSKCEQCYSKSQIKYNQKRLSKNKSLKYYCKSCWLNTPLNSNIWAMIVGLIFTVLYFSKNVIKEIDVIKEIEQTQFGNSFFVVMISVLFIAFTTSSILFSIVNYVLIFIMIKRNLILYHEKSKTIILNSLFLVFYTIMVFVIKYDFQPRPL